MCPGVVSAVLSVTAKVTPFNSALFSLLSPGWPSSDACSIGRESSSNRRSLLPRSRHRSGRPGDADADHFRRPALRRRPDRPARHGNTTICPSSVFSWPSTPPYRPVGSTFSSWPAGRCRNVTLAIPDASIRLSVEISFCSAATGTWSQIAALPGTRPRQPSGWSSTPLLGTESAASVIDTVAVEAVAVLGR